MLVEYVLGGVVTAALLIYLVYALLRPEKFWTLIGWLEILLYCAIIVALARPLGGYMTRVFNGEPTFLSPALKPVEGVLYRAGGIDERREQDWLTYTVAMLLFHVGGFLILYALMRFQAVLWWLQPWANQQSAHRPRQGRYRQAEGREPFRASAN